jgi:hypothetical protein
MTFGGYDVGRSAEAPIETVIFLSPFFRDVNLTAFVIRLTSTDQVSQGLCMNGRGSLPCFILLRSAMT